MVSIELLRRKTPDFLDRSGVCRSRSIQSEIKLRRFPHTPQYGKRKAQAMPTVKLIIYSNISPRSEKCGLGVSQLGGEPDQTSEAPFQDRRTLVV
jgi:hypothetical protein